MSTFLPPRTAPSLRERARQAMRAEVEAVAFQLFLERGYEQTSIDEITAHAGISRSSFFRYFATKEDLVIGSFTDWGFEILEALTSRPDDEPVWASLEHALDPVISATLAEPAGARQITRMIYGTPALQARRFLKTIQWRELLIPEISRRLGVDSSDKADPRPQALAASMLECFTAATICWAHDDDMHDLGALVSRAMDSLHR